MTALDSITPQRFYRGLTISEFIEGMRENRERFEENYRNFQLRPTDAETLKKLSTPLNVLVVTEDWCGDALRYLPALFRMEEAAGNWDLRLFYRDENPDLSDRWLKNGTQRAIPAIAFFDKDWNELTHFIEKPILVYAAEAQACADFAAKHSDLPDAALPYKEMSETTQELFAPYIRALRMSRVKEWQQLFVEEVLGMLQEAFSRAMVA